MNESTKPQDDLLKALFSEAALKDDTGITEKVMLEIRKNPSSKKVEYEAPISKKAWIFIICFFTGTLAYSLMAEASFYFEIPDYMFEIPAYLIAIKNNLSGEIPTVKFPQLSLSFLTTILAFNVIGMYFILSYWRARNT
ncbi:MAG: hypothetical protein AAF600_21290 [Bacteroidota bacterium]